MYHQPEDSPHTSAELVAETDFFLHTWPQGAFMLPRGAQKLKHLQTELERLKGGFCYCFNGLATVGKSVVVVSSALRQQIVCSLCERHTSWQPRRLHAMSRSPRGGSWGEMCVLRCGTWWSASKMDHQHLVLPPLRIPVPLKKTLRSLAAILVYMCVNSVSSLQVLFNKCPV